MIYGLSRSWEQQPNLILPRYKATTTIVCGCGENELANGEVIMTEKSVRLERLNIVHAQTDWGCRGVDVTTMLHKNPHSKQGLQ